MTWCRYREDRLPVLVVVAVVPRRVVGEPDSRRRIDVQGGDRRGPEVDRGHALRGLRIRVEGQYVAGVAAGHPDPIVRPDREARGRRDEREADRLEPAAGHAEEPEATLSLFDPLAS